MAVCAMQGNAMQGNDMQDGAMVGDDMMDGASEEKNGTTRVQM